MSVELSNYLLNGSLSTVDRLQTRHIRKITMEVLDEIVENCRDSASGEWWFPMSMKIVRPHSGQKIPICSLSGGVKKSNIMSQRRIESDETLNLVYVGRIGYKVE